MYMYVCKHLLHVHVYIQFLMRESNIVFSSSYTYTCKCRYAHYLRTCIVLAAADGIVQATDRTVLAEDGGYIVIKKSWAVSILHRLGL